MRPNKANENAVALPNVGISSCLLGEPVRYDGGHKWSHQIHEWIAPYVKFQSICPESGIGLPTPRPPIDLVLTDGDIEARGKLDQRLNPSVQLKEYAGRVADRSLDGYILMQRSPSCALASAKVYRDGKLAHDRGTGVYTAELLRCRPGLLAIEEQRLARVETRFAFLCGVFLHAAWRSFRPHGLKESKHFHDRFGYVCAGFSADVWAELNQLATEATDSASQAYEHALERELGRWLVEPLALETWLGAVQRHLDIAAPIACKPEFLTQLVRSLDDMPRKGLTAPIPLPFFSAPLF